AGQHLSRTDRPQRIVLFKVLVSRIRKQNGPAAPPQRGDTSRSGRSGAARTTGGETLVDLLEHFVLRRILEWAHYWNPDAGLRPLSVDPIRDEGIKLRARRRHAREIGVRFYRPPCLQA